MPPDTLTTDNSTATDRPPLNIVLAGEWLHPYYEQALAGGFHRFGARVTPFRTLPYLWVRGKGTLQKSLKFGPAINRLNRELLKLVDDVQPDVVFLFICHHVFAGTVRQIKLRHPRTVVVSYNIDNPFEDGKKFLRWRHYLAHAKLCDLNYFVRPRTVEHARQSGIPHPRVLMQFYVKDFHRPLPHDQPAYRHDVLFVGHYEPDGRGELLSHLLLHGIAVRIFGNRWEELPRNSPIRRLHPPIAMVSGEEYVRLLAASKIALVFLSGVNRDPYTSRCFEIPACKTFMLAPRTPEIQALYQEDKEVVLYENKEELLAKVQKYLGDDEARARIAEAGHQRCLRGRQSHMDRCAAMLADITSCLAGTRLASPNQN